MTFRKTIQRVLPPCTHCKDYPVSGRKQPLCANCRTGANLLVPIFWHSYNPVDGGDRYVFIEDIWSLKRC